MLSASIFPLSTGGSHVLHHNCWFSQLLPEGEGDMEEMGAAARRLTAVLEIAFQQF